VKFIHMRPPGTKHKYGEGGITIAYELQDAVVLAAAAYCSRKDQYNKTVGRKIAASRMLNQPIKFHMEGKIAHRHIPLFLNALLQYANVWKLEEDVYAVADRATFKVFSCPIVGPDGKLVTVRVESRVGDKVYHLDGTKAVWVPSGWLLRTPSWARTMIEELIA